MKIKKYDARASQDITIDALPKQDNPNNSDLIPIQGASLTEATSIQQLRNKILGGEAQLREDLGSLLFSSAPISSPDYILMDGTEYTQTQYPIFYGWLLEQLTSIQTKFTVDTVAGTFMVPNYFNQIPYVSNNDNAIPPYYVGTNPTLVTNSATVFGTYCYIKVNYEGASTIASPYIKTDGSVAMDLDYTPTDMNDVTTKKYIEDRLLNYELPLAFDINDIGRRVPYYKNAERNPTLIALDGTKYLIADYPDFDYTQEGFETSGSKFWFANIELEIKSFQNEIQPSKEWFPIPHYSERVKGETLSGKFEFKSKMIYNFLNSPQGAPYLSPNDIFGENAKNNSGFSILNPAEFLIRANYNNWGKFSDIEMPPNSKMYKFKLRRASIGDNGAGAYRLGVNFNSSSSTGYIGATGEVSYLKIQPDYMVAKIQRVGSLASAGDLKSDRSVLLTGSGTFNTNQIAGMKDLKDSNIIVGNSSRVITTLDSKLNQIDTNITTINSNIGAVDISGLQTQVDTNITDIADIKTVNTNQDSRLTALEAFNPIFKIAQSRRLVKPNTNIVTISGQGRSFPIDSFIPTTTAGYESDTFTIELYQGKRVIKEKMDNGITTRHLNIRLTLGHTKTMTSKKIQLAVFLFRGNDTGYIDDTAIATGSSMFFYDTDARGESTNLLSVVVNGANDAFVTHGWFIVLKSLNPNTDDLIFTKGDLLINIVNSN